MTLPDSSSQLLSPVDHTVPKVYFTFYLSFLLKNPQAGVESIQKGLTTLINQLPFLAKDVAPSHDENHDNVHCIQPPSAKSQSIPMLQIRHYLNESVRSMLATASCTGAEDLQYSERYAPLLTVMDPQESQPILRFVANVMVDGIILSLSFNHMAADGTGIGNILELLSECCRNEQKHVGPQRFEFELRRQLASPSTTAEKRPLNTFWETYTPEETFHCLDSNTWSTATTSMASELNTFRFRIPIRKVKVLKDICTSVLLSHPEGDNMLSKEPGAFISSNDVLTALLSICLQQTKTAELALKDDHDYTVAFVANLRSRMHPPWPEHYIGVLLTMVLVSRSELINYVHEKRVDLVASEVGLDKDELKQITNLAMNMRKKLQDVDDRYVRGLLAHMQQQRDWSQMNIKGGDFSYSSIRHLKVHDLDWGPDLGKITGFRLFFGLLEDFCLILPADPGGDWDMQISLRPGYQRALMENRLFRWATSD
ncbi:hypothetical protein CBS147343_7721 [Aspergillus niger]|uniref:O-acetyltransferase n=2 Tax=Aspergillus niger TaxID=5061 RepID=A0A9W6EBK4_ASPNG|nr:hypothetical protein CBS11350_10547 [Aspergillus niger]KAI2852679.1 hypothetical protein CBS12448_8209 [Aspergillus niger]KAI2905036.1 hypothetical protein CBS11852_1271 [Aspergillus niger]KAI2910654.1 hypothetical protein CBS147371_8722 [Aspergillus niger]KAI2930527.1 hypothetical protein CBS147320_3229 [Aspergillus niger]